MTALMGTFVKINTMADGTPRLVLDMQCTLAELAEMNLVPGAPFGVARLTPEAKPAERPKGGEFAKMAGNFCADPIFWTFLTAETGISTASEDEAAVLVRRICKVKSRAEIDHNDEARLLFMQMIRTPFLDYRNNAR